MREGERRVSRIADGMFRCRGTRRAHSCSGATRDVERLYTDPRAIKRSLPGNLTQARVELGPSLPFFPREMHSSTRHRTQVASVDKQTYIHMTKENLKAQPCRSSCRAPICLAVQLCVDSPKRARHPRPARRKSCTTQIRHHFDPNHQNSHCPWLRSWRLWARVTKWACLSARQFRRQNDQQSAVKCRSAVSHESVARRASQAARRARTHRIGFPIRLGVQLLHQAMDLNKIRAERIEETLSLSVTRCGADRDRVVLK